MALNILSRISGRSRNLRHYIRCNIFYFQKKNFSFTQVLECTDKPVTYSKTEASKLTTNEIFFPKRNPAVLDCERFIIIGSLVVFMVYFLILREENKLDEILAGTYRYDGDEELKLVNAILQGKFRKLNTEDLERRLKEIRGQK